MALDDFPQVHGSQKKLWGEIDNTVEILRPQQCLCVQMCAYVCKCVFMVQVRVLHMLGTQSTTKLTFSSRGINFRGSHGVSAVYTNRAVQDFEAP